MGEHSLLKSPVKDSFFLHLCDKKYVKLESFGGGGGGGRRDEKYQLLGK